MNQSTPSHHWRQMFERDARGSSPRAADAAAPPSPSPAFAGGYDDGHDPAASGAAPLSPEAVTDAAAMALALDAPDYRPWILQRGKTRPGLMLHLRRFDARAQQWQGWAVAYPHLVAVEYTGDRLLSLDFGARQFVLEGEGFGELIDHLQAGHVLCVQEFAPSVWAEAPSGPRVSAIRLVGGG